MQRIYGFKYEDVHLPPLFRLETIGRQTVSDAGYDWDGTRRPGDSVILQYTLEGNGSLLFEGRRYDVPRGSAFLATVPGRHRYFFEGGEERPWSFLWIRLQGVHTRALWSEWQRTIGPVVAFPREAPAFRLLHRLYEDAAAQSLDDAYTLSLRLYEWIVALQKQLRAGSAAGGDIPPEYQAIYRWMLAEYRSSPTLDELAARLNVSKHHFCKRFAHWYGLPPMQLLRKRKVEEASRLLRQSGMPIGEIAAYCGFESVSYFGKAFRQLAGCSPTEFREASGEGAVDALTLL